MTCETCSVMDDGHPCEYHRGYVEALREAARELPGFDEIRTHGDAARWLRNRATEAVA